MRRCAVVALAGFWVLGFQPVDSHGVAQEPNAVPDAAHSPKAARAVIDSVWTLPDISGTTLRARLLSGARLESGSPALASMDFEYTPVDFDILKPRTRPLTAFGRIAYGADSGANLGLWVGVLGHAAGFWDERTIWAIMGAGAAAGAAYGSAADPGSPRFQPRRE